MPPIFRAIEIPACAACINIMISADRKILIRVFFLSANSILPPLLRAVHKHNDQRWSEDSRLERDCYLNYQHTNQPRASSQTLHSNLINSFFKPLLSSPQHDIGMMIGAGWRKCKIRAWWWLVSKTSKPITKPKYEFLMCIYPERPASCQKSYNHYSLDPGLMRISNNQDIL